MDRKWKTGANVAPPALDNASDGYASNGNPGGGVPATVPGAHWYHMITEELMSVLAAGGVAPDKTVVTQLRDAINAMITAATMVAASQAELEAAAITTKATTPGRQHFHPSAAKAWGYANAAGTSVLASYNVSSLTDNAAGDATWNWTTALSSANYAPGGLGQEFGGTTMEAFSQDGNNARTTTAMRVLGSQVSDITSRAAIDQAQSVIVMGDI